MSDGTKGYFDELTGDELPFSKKVRQLPREVAVLMVSTAARKGYLQAHYLNITSAAMSYVFLELLAMSRTLVTLCREAEDGFTDSMPLAIERQLAELIGFLTYAKENAKLKPWVIELVKDSVTGFELLVKALEKAGAYCENIEQYWYHEAWETDPHSLAVDIQEYSMQL